MADNSAVIQRVTELYSANKWRELLEYLLPHTETEDLDLLWQVIRAHYRVGKHVPKNKQEIAALVKKAMEMVERGLKIGQNHFQMQKWAGITTSWFGDVAGTKQKVAGAVEISDHFKKAIELDGSDPSVKHLLGRWCYNVASVSWLQKKAASLVYSTPPSSSYEEALSYFNAAEETKPGFFSANWLFLGKTHQQLGHKEEARKWLQQVLDKDSDNPEHQESKAEATALLHKL